MNLVDTHCHIHEADYPLPVDDVLRRAKEQGVTKMICVGTSVRSSKDALAFAANHPQCYASIGVHPHDTKEGWGEISVLAGSEVSDIFATKQVSVRRDVPGDSSLSPAELAFAQTSSDSQEGSPGTSGVVDSVSLAKMSDTSTGAARKLVAIGEIGLDYFYAHSPRDIQIQALESQIQTALDHDLPIIFHVREAFSDFWPIFDNFHGIRGELHSFTDSQANLDDGLKRGLSVGVNGISTFTKDPAQQKLFAIIPLDRLLLETDAPFLTPAPKRGTVNEPAFVSYVAAYHAAVRGITTDEVARVTTANASALFAL
jgi:TatD DNase family protein